MKRRKADWIDYIARRKCLLKHIIKEEIERGIEVTERQGIRRTQLVVNFKET
jgi:hypothetical protein